MRSSGSGPVLKGRWYFVVTACSGGLLAWLPFVHAGNHLRRPSVTKRAWYCGGAAVVIGVLMTLSPTGENSQAGSQDPLSMVGGLAAMATIALGCVQQLWIPRSRPHSGHVSDARSHATVAWST